MKLLLHTCCGPCFLGVWEDPKLRDLEVTNFYFNPNIYPESEYQKRLENLRIAASGKTAGVVVGEYRPKDYDSAVSGYENAFPERCVYCYQIRLEQAALYAKANGFDAFSTTLLVSPYQQHESLKALGEEIAKAIGIEFYYSDWRPYFRKGQDEARFIPIYRQKYCGCKHSLRERNLPAKDF